MYFDESNKYAELDRTLQVCTNIKSRQNIDILKIHKTSVNWLNPLSIPCEIPIVREGPVAICKK